MGVLPVCMFVYHVPEETRGVLDPLDLQLQTVVKHYLWIVWVLGIEPWSSWGSSQCSYH